MDVDCWNYGDAVRGNGNDYKLSGYYLSLGWDLVQNDIIEVDLMAGAVAVDPKL